MKNDSNTQGVLKMVRPIMRDPLFLAGKVSFLFPWRISQTPWKLIRVQINRQNRYFSMWVPYYSMVKLAREANASWKIRKTVIVDLDKLDAKIEQQIL